MFECPNGPHRRGVRCNECSSKIPFGMEPPSMPVDGLKKELERFEAGRFQHILKENARFCFRLVYETPVGSLNLCT